MSKASRFDLFFIFPICLLVTISLFVLKSITPQIFPGYLFLIFVGFLAFILFSYLDFDIISLFSRHFYIGSIVLLILTLVIGRITRGVVRWIPFGFLTLQAAEIVKPFLLVFFANNFKKYTVFLMLVPVILILIQPSLGVAFLLAMGFLGITLSSNMPKKYFVYLILAIAVAAPLFWYLLAPYQKSRLAAYINPYSDPQGAGYNSIQSQITVGAGRFWGRGLGKGIQTQLSFLPEKNTDFIFAAISEELGFVGGFSAIAGLFMVLWRLTVYINHAKSPQARMYLAGLFLTLTAQSLVHIGMNLGLLPITGVPLPLISAGGSSFLATMIGLGIAQGARKM